MTQEELRTLQVNTFRRGSRTYFNSSLFFPEKVREDVVRLYAFVRIADDYVDKVPQDREGFLAFCDHWHLAQQGHPVPDPVVADFAVLAQERSFDPSWTEAFLASMAMDMGEVVFTNLDQTLSYIYGSAEVIGLYMCAILGLPSEAFHGAQMQGRAMQMINFIRDIAEDNRLGRTYLPMGETTLPDLTEFTCRHNLPEFTRFLGRQLDRYDQWQKEAYEAYHYMPYRYRVPVKTATDMYNWTGMKIRQEPLVVFERKVKPPKYRIILQGLINALWPVIR